MAFTTADDYKLILNGGDIVTEADGTPVQVTQNGPWPQAFADSVAANRASEGIRILRDHTLAEPNKNLIDIVQGDRNVSNNYQTTYGPNKDWYYSEDDTKVVSGSKCLVINPNAGSLSSGLTIPQFPVMVGRSYKLSVTWTTDNTAETLRIVVVFNTGTNATPPLIAPWLGRFFCSSANTRQTDTIVFTAGAGQKRAYIAFGKDVPTSANTIWINEIVLEEVPDAFRADTSNTAQWTTGWQTVTFGSEEYDYGSNFAPATGVFTAPTAGLYQFNGTVGFASAAWAAGNRLSCALWVTPSGGALTFKSRGVDREITAASTEFVGLTVADTLYLNRLDTVVLRAYHDNGANRSLSTTAGDCVFSGFRVS